MCGAEGGGGSCRRPLLRLLRGGSLRAGLLLLFLQLLCLGVCCHGRVEAGPRAAGKCIEGEREALLAVRADISGAEREWLSSWGREQPDCCLWQGVGCDNVTGHVVKLDLHHHPFMDYTNPNPSKVNPSLLNLTSLKYLDLSFNHFGGAPIPSFLGSLGNLEYLGLSSAGFAGLIPPQIQRLQNLHSLDISGLYKTRVQNLHWLSHLSQLQYLDMSEVDLSNATDWLRVINMLPSLSVLRLSGCSLPNLPTTLPHVNITSLSTLHLAYNNFNCAFPLWLSNISSLVNLALGDVYGPIPDGLWELKNLKILYLSGSHLQIGQPRHMGESKNLQQLSLEGVVDRLPESFGNITSLQHVDLSNSNSELPQSLGKLNSLRELSLFRNNFSGGIPESLGMLRNLQDLRLGFNNFNGGIPESLGNLSRLGSLSLMYVNFTGRIPESLWNLENLTVLELYGSNLLVEIPKQVGKSTNLRELYLGGVTVRFFESLGNISSLRSLWLSEVMSELPKSLGNLSQLESLRLDANNMSVGILESLGNLINLKHMELISNTIEGDTGGGVSLRTFGDLCNLSSLELYGNNFRGGAKVTELIEGLSRCPRASAMGSNLESLWLGNNAISGPIPPSIGELASLRELHLGNNQLSGRIPSSLGNLSNLWDLDLSSNALVGVLSEAHFANLSSLDYVDLSHNALLSLKIPSDWIPPFQLASFSIAACRVGPNFPTWLLSQKRLFRRLDLSNNIIHDRLPVNIFNSFAPYSTLDLSNNLISGPISISSDGPRLEYLDLSHNDINGSIPLSLCHIESLQVLDISSNNLSGKIPLCWYNTSLIVVKLSNNMLSGPIPNSIGSLIQLQSLHLDRNDLIGEIPSSFHYLTQLVTLDLGENKLSGELPTWLGERLPLLQLLRLRSNRFYGNIPKTLSYLQSLQVLDLACNRLSGSILLSFQNLTAMVNTKKTRQSLLSFSTNASAAFEESIMIVPKGNELEYTTILSLVTIIDLSGNNLSGQIPEEITSLHGLIFLNLSNNHFEGGIPEHVDLMKSLESLDLSFNQLSRRIPSSVSTMTFLARFNVSYNNLSGRIPLGSQLQTFDPSSYIGNSGLCGKPLFKPCPGDVLSQDPVFQVYEYGDKDESSMMWFYISMGPGFVIGFWGFIGVLLLMGRNKRIIYFQFIDKLGDELYVMTILYARRMKLKLLSWIHK